MTCPAVTFPVTPSAVASAEAGYADLRPVHGMAFQVLRSGATSSELAARLGVTKQAAEQLVDDLERRGYVRREPHPQGGRRRAAAAARVVSGRPAGKPVERSGPGS